MTASRDPSEKPEPPDEEEFLAVLAATVPRRSPPPALRERILREGTPHVLTFLSRDQGIWLPEAEGQVMAKELFHDSGDRLASRLLRARARAMLPSPSIGGCRTLFVLEGRIRSEELALESGDCVDVGPASQEWTIEEDAMLLELSRAGSPPEQSTVHRAYQATWFPQTPEINIRPLSDPRDASRQLLELKAAPNATLTEHEHAGVEELFVIRGSCVVEGRELNAGDYHRAAAGSLHHPTRTGKEGCVLLCSVRAI